MKHHKFQQIRVRITGSGASVRFDAQTDKQYSRIRGIFVLLPEDRALAGTSLGLRVNKEEVFDDAHDVRLLTCGEQVPPNEKFFFFEEHLEAGGSTVEGRVTDGGLTSIGGGSESAPPDTVPFEEYELCLYLWLTNDPLK
ncbi:MAG: hypothetical protein ACOYOO_05885 [Saprospiraceae bacterium]